VQQKVVDWICSVVMAIAQEQATLEVMAEWLMVGSKHRRCALYFAPRC
jgi:hypothetical protein